MLRQSLFSIVSAKNLGRITQPCRHYTSENAILTDINKQMFRVLDKAASANLGSRATLTRILRLAKELKENNVKFDADTYEHILSAYAKANEPSQALILYKQMSAQGIKPTRNFYHKALLFAARNGDSALQAKMLHYMEQSNYPKTTKTYYCMFLCMRETLELEHALDTIDIMKRDNIKMNLHSYATVIDMAVHLNEVEIAHQLLKEAEKLNEFGQQAGILYTSVLQSAAFNGHYTIVKDIWKKASKYKTDEGNLLYILDLAGKHGDTKIATEVIRIIGERGYTYRECHFAPLIDTFAATGDITNTFQLFHVMRKVGITPNKKTALPLAYRLGQDKNAIFKAKHILEKQSPVDVTAFNLVIHALAYNKEIDAALSLYQKSKELQVTPNSETLDAVLDACIHCKDAGLGKDVYEELLAKGVQPTSTSLSKMVTLMCTQEDYEEAFMYLEEMKKRDMVPLRGCYYKLVKVLASARDARLEMALDDMKAYGYSISTHISQFIENEKTTATLN